MLFGSRARGDAIDTSDWDLMVRSAKLLPHNVMFLEGIIPEDGDIGDGRKVQSVSLSDYEARHHTAEDGSLAVAWSRDGIVIAGVDKLIEHARRKPLVMNDVNLVKMNEKALAQMLRAWNDIREWNDENATREERMNIAPTVVDACELVAKFTMYGYEVLGSKIHPLDRLAKQLRREKTADEEALEDANTIKSMNGAAAITRQGVYAASAFEDEETRARTEHDMRWERTAERWGTLLALHGRTLARLQKQDGPAGAATTEAIMESLRIAEKMLKGIANPEVAKSIPPEAERATRDWIDRVRVLKQTRTVPSLTELNVSRSIEASPNRRRAGTALRRGDLASALCLTEYWEPRKLPESEGRERILTACEQWKKSHRMVDLEEVEALMRTERHKAFRVIGRAGAELCKRLRTTAKTAKEAMETEDSISVKETLMREGIKIQGNGLLDAQDIEIIVNGVTEAAQRNELDRLDRERIVHTAMVDRTRREREHALREAARNEGLQSRRTRDPRER